jgi:hypothetical protein
MKCPYLTPAWQPIAERMGLSAAQVIRIWRNRYDDAAKQGFRKRTIRRNQLDNPYMTELARKVIINDIRLASQHVLEGRKLGRYTSIGKRQNRRAA